MTVGRNSVTLPEMGWWLLTVISSDSGKCLDYRVMEKTCKACESWESLKGGTEENEQFLPYHECDINHEGSSGSMEAAGIAECFLWI